jgi:multidrug transporter EmrE-like cation transporter
MYRRENVTMQVCVAYWAWFASGVFVTLRDTVMFHVEQFQLSAAIDLICWRPASLHLQDELETS